MTFQSHGGFLLENTSFVRAAEDSSLSPLEVNALDNRLMSAYPVFDSLNQLGSTPWKINVPVLDLVNLSCLRQGHIRLLFRSFTSSKNINNNQ